MSAPVLHDADSWLDLRVGDICMIHGILESVGYGSPATLMVRFVDWNQLVLRCKDGRLTKPIPIGADVVVRARRSEDGLDALVIWRAGTMSVPIPLW